MTTPDDRRNTMSTADIYVEAEAANQALGAAASALLLEYEPGPGVANLVNARVRKEHPELVERAEKAQIALARAAGESQAKHDAAAVSAKRNHDQQRKQSERYDQELGEWRTRVGEPPA